jgi:N-acetyl-1-D-myo-inositol-2-amino-2-deoxy-alpha-D-glucopyranoside deacetylase/mycothiol S-conjugate amidase
MNPSYLKNDEFTILAVHAHPDDESISTGGILAKYSAKGLRTVLAYSTGGEAGDILNPEFVAPKPGLNIKEIRAIELAAAVKVLAVETVYYLGYRDSGMAGSPKGTYLHPDHIMANRVTLRAFQASGDAQFEIGETLEPWQPAKLYYTAIPLERLRRMYRIVKERGEEPGFDPEVLGTPENKISTVVDVREYLSRKLEALDCHQSQMNPNSIMRRMPEEWRLEVMGYEHFECVQGCPAADTKETDLFEGLYPN